MRTIRLGYIGCGYMAQTVHLPNLSTIVGCELLALAELRPELGRRVQQALGIPRLYRDHEALLADPDIDAIAVSAAFSAQGQIARDALEAGKDVFMEKPMAVSVAQADAILMAERRTGKRVMVGYMKRYDAGNELAKAQIDLWRASDEVGPVTYARNHGFCGNWTAGATGPAITTDEAMPPAPPPQLPEWLPTDHADQYLSYLQQYTHNINLLRWLLNAGDDVSLRAVDLDDDGYTGLVVFDMAGVRATLETARLSHYRWDEHTQVYFRDGWVTTWAPPLLLKNQPAEVEVYRAGQTQRFERPIPRDAWSWAYRRETEAFIRCLQTGEPFRSSAGDTRTDVRLFEEVFQAFLEQRHVL
jgi:predicted dehydrogenase